MSTPADTITSVRDLYEAGVCPGCGTRLELVAGARDFHTIDGLPVSGYRASLHPDGVCSWSADDLTSLVLIGTGVVR